jgi:hypothetical protein
MIRDVHTGSGSRMFIPNSDLDFSSIPDPGSRGQKGRYRISDPDSSSALNPALKFPGLKQYSVSGSIATECLSIFITLSKSFHLLVQISGFVMLFCQSLEITNLPTPLIRSVTTKVTTDVTFITNS